MERRPDGLKACMLARPLIRSFTQSGSLLSCHRPIVSYKTCYTEFVFCAICSQIQHILSYMILMIRHLNHKNDVSNITKYTK
jgi:hypothetical protein